MAPDDSESKKSQTQSSDTERVDNSPNLNPVAVVRTAASKIRGSDSEEG